jgi:SAM-dependent methyltransferase
MGDIRKQVREEYAQIAREAGSAGCCGPAAPSCGGPTSETPSREMGYTKGDLASAPEGADLGLGCGNPHAFAGLMPDEVVLDLGSGAGLDCFLAADRVGSGGRVIGVDMTPEMVVRAQENAKRVGAANVEFRQGEIERLPVEDASVDVILSNCVVNLSPDKPAVFREAFRVLKPGGRLAISDVVATRPLPEAMREDVALHVGCVAGAAVIDDLEAMLADAGFEDVQVKPRLGSEEMIASWFPETEVADYVVSATIEAIRPA